MGSSSIDWAQLNRFCLKTDTEFSLRNVVFKYKHDSVLDENRTMVNMQKLFHLTLHPVSYQTEKPREYNTAGERIVIQLNT
jgi:hypothetical protein